MAILIDRGDVGVATDVGRVREHNEDSVLARGRVFAVADGMGGHAAGEVASRIAVEVLAELADRDELHPDDVVHQLAVANRRLLESVTQTPERRGMGTTAAGVAVVTAKGGEQWAVFNVGDSRVYRWVSGSFTRLSTDHSEVQELMDAGVITEAEAAVHPLRNVITRSLGTDPAPVPDLWVMPPVPGERFVLCSDGLSNELSDEQIGSVLDQITDPQTVADALVRAAVEAGGRDNVSVVVVSASSRE